MSLFNHQELKIKSENRYGSQPLYKSFDESLAKLDSINSSKEFDIFLSHRFINSEEILILKNELETYFKCTTYIDWIDDSEISRDNVNKKTAETLKKRMNQCKSLVFAYSKSSTTSKWMPWELGFFDGSKGLVVILPIVDKPTNDNSFIGQEYLGLYPYITKDFNLSGLYELNVNEPDSKRITEFHKWLDQGTK